MDNIGKGGVINDIVRKNSALETEIARRMAIESALGEALLQKDAKIAEFGAYIIALVRRIGGEGARIEFTLDELKVIPAAARLEIRSGSETTPYVLTVLAPVDGKTAGEAAEEESHHA